MTTFATEADRTRELEAAGRMERAWRCELHRFAGPFAPIDFYVLRARRLCAVVEVKGRTCPASQYPDALLSLRKWWALDATERATTLPALFVVAYTDELRWIRVRDIDASRLELGGHTHPRAPADREPLIRVPIESMRPV